MGEIHAMNAEDDGSVIGYMCATDWECEIGAAEFVAINAPGHRLRATPDVPGVRVGAHVAPPSGPHIVEQLENILWEMESPFEAHCRYEDLHPFTDGNGRSGMMRDRGGGDQAMAESLGFLHTFYYQTLSASDARAA